MRNFLRIVLAKNEIFNESSEKVKSKPKIRPLKLAHNSKSLLIMISRRYIASERCY